MDKKTITIEQEKVRDLYDTLTNYPAISKEQVIHEMEKCFGKETFAPKDVTERIKTFEDAMEDLGNHALVNQYRRLIEEQDVQMDKSGADIIAYLKLRIITAALNEGWEPQFTQDEWRWFPWHCLWTEEELAGKDEEWKQERHLRPMDNHKGECAGLAYAYSSDAPSYSGADFGSRLCFRTESLADYAGKQFIDLWMDFYLIRK